MASSSSNGQPKWTDFSEEDFSWITLPTNNRYEELEKQLAASKNTINNLIKKRDYYKGKAKELQEKLTSSQQTIGILKGQRKILKKKINHLTNQLSKARSKKDIGESKMSGLQQSLETHIAKYAASQREVLRWQQRTKRLQSLYDQQVEKANVSEKYAKELEHSTPKMVALAMQKRTPQTNIYQNIRRLRQKALPFGALGSGGTVAASGFIWVLAMFAIIGRID